MRSLSFMQSARMPMINFSDDHLLTAAQVSEITGYKVQTLAVWRTGRGGPGPAFQKHGRSIRYKGSDLRAWQAGKTFKNTVEARFAQAGQ